MKKIVVIFGIAILILSIASLLYQFINLESTQQNILYVGGSGIGNFSSIKDAIKSCKPGDIIYIYTGVYYESNIIIDKDNIKLIGKYSETTIIDGSGNDSDRCHAVINIIANSTDVQGLTIKNGYFGINIKGNKNIIENIIISDNGWNKTNCSNISYGLHLSDSENNIIANNIFYNNTVSNIYLFNSNYNIINQNNITNSTDGIILVESKNNSFYYNNIFNNENIGLKINNYSFNNLIYANNFLGNIQNAYDESSNIWFYNEKGNFWDNYNGTDENNDSLGDIPYNISGGNNQDKYPLISQYKIPAITDEFTVDTISLYTMLAIGLIAAIVFVLPIAYYWRKKYFT